MPGVPAVTSPEKVFIKRSHRVFWQQNIPDFVMGMARTLQLATRNNCIVLVNRAPAVLLNLSLTYGFASDISGQWVFPLIQLWKQLPHQVP